MSDAFFSRRDVLSVPAGLAGTAALAAATPAIATPTVRRPNIVWVVCHDIHAPLLGCYGNPLAQTPTIDAFARQGVRFDQAFSVAPVCAPSRFALVTGMYPDSCGPAHHMRGVGHVPEEFASLPTLMRRAGYYCTNNVFTDYNCDLDPQAIWDECSVTAHWRKRPAGKPFFCVYNYLATHESRAIHFEGPLVTDPAKVAVPPYLPDLPEIRTALAQNVDLVERQDAAFRHLLDELEADGLADETIVFFMADHGGVAPRSKRYCYEEGLRIPFIVRVPDTFAHLRAGLESGHPTGRIVSNIDVAPTVLSLGGVTVPAHMHGRPFLGADAVPRRVAFSSRNRMDERYDMVRTARDARFRYIRNYAPHRIYGQHNGYPWQLRGYQAWEAAHLAGTLTPAQDRFWREKPAEELYDVAADPFALRNLADDPAHAARKAALSGALDAHMAAINDNGFIPESAAAEGYKPSRLPGAYPLPDVMRLAGLAIRRTAADAPAFVAALAHPNEVMRFWAAQGLLMAAPLPTDAVGPLRDRLAGERSPQVRCIVAEALARSDGEAAASALAALLDTNPSPRVKLMALQSLTYMPTNAAIHARPAIGRIAGGKDTYLVEAARYLELRLAGDYRPDKMVFPEAAGGMAVPMGDPRI